MPDDPKNKLAGVIALKRKDVVKSPAKPAAAAPPKPKEPPKPKGMDKLMAAKGQVVKIQKSASPPRPAPKAPPAAAGKVVSGKAPVTAAATSATALPSAPQAPPKGKPAAQKPKQAPAPRRPSGPGAFSQMFGKLKVYIHEEIQEIKQELAAQHLFSPIKNGIQSIKKGASYLKNRISSEDSSGDMKSAYKEAGRVRAYDRSDPTGDIAAVVDERKQAAQFGAALEKLGSIRQRGTSRQAKDQDQQQDESALRDGALDLASAEAAAAPGGQRVEAVPPSSGSSSETQPAMSAEEVEARQIGAALEQMGSIRQRGTSRQAKDQDQQQDESASRDGALDLVSAEAAAAPGGQRAEAVPRAPESLPKTQPAMSAEEVEARQIGAALEQMGSIRQREASQQAKAQGQPRDASAPRDGALDEVGQPSPVRAEMSDRTPSSDAGPGMEGPPRSAPLQPVPTPTSAQAAAKKKGAPRKASKTEHQIRAIRALQILYGNPLWRKVIVDPAEKPSQLYLPRKTFEANFAEVEFRNALKAASRIVMRFAADVKEPQFDERTIDEVLAFEFPKIRGKEDADEKQIAEKCDKETAKRIERFVESDEMKRLLENSGARLSSFVPGIEIIARIYLGLKKGHDMDPAVRMDIQKDVMFKYQRMKYPEKATRKARNVALRYFFEHLVDYGLETYKERKAAALEMKVADLDMENRLEGIRDVCCNLAAERASKAVLSGQVITELRERIRGAISDYEMGVEPGSGRTADVMSEEEDEEEERTAAATSEEGGKEEEGAKEQTEVAPQSAEKSGEG